MILCCGEALIDMIPTPTLAGGEAFAPHSGGAVFNTAIALGRLGCAAGMLTGLSDDLFGQQLRQTLADSGVDTALSITSNRPTTLAFVRLSNGHATYTFYDENSAGRMITPDDLPTIPQSVSALYFGGISLACEPGAETYATLAEREGSSRAVMLDPNIRPSFIRDEAAYRARIRRMVAVADIVKVSDDDLNWLVPSPDDLASKADTLRREGASIVIVTQGGDGATAYFGNGESVTVAAETVTVVDTVGAGDTFNAGVMASLERNGLLCKNAIANLSTEALHDALAFGAKIAAVTVSRAGANPPWAHEL